MDIASDDLFAPFILLLSLRIAWLILAIFAFLLVTLDAHRFQYIYLLVHISLSAINIPLDASIIFLSLCGTLSTPGLRRYCTVFLLTSNK